MKPVYLAGRALASVLGLTLDQALASLRSGKVPAATAYRLAGHGDVPYQRISGPGQDSGWEVRARALITQVAADAGAAQARNGALFIATCCHDGDSAEHTRRDMDFHALSRRIGGWLDWRGPVFLVSSACTSSIQALLSATEWLRAGTATQALVLGVELDNQLTVPGFAALQLLSTGRSKPFALQRDGLVLGEAVAALRLATQQTAPWQLRGGANVVDGTHPTSASAKSVQQMCQRALAGSGLTATDVDLIKVQAAGSPGNDASEAEGLRAAFASVPALVSLKPLIGHCMGACGAAEIALLLECLEQGYWPCYPDAADPALGVQLATQAPMRQRCVLAAILGFGGSHAAVVLERNGP
jgi:3-oxoacyl-[acyl-carrier-protein] synthase I